MNTFELLKIYMHVETKTRQQYHNVWFDLLLEDLKVWICTTMSIFFCYCKTKTVIWQAGKNKSIIIYCHWKNIYIPKNEHTLFYE